MDTITNIEIHTAGVLMLLAYLCLLANITFGSLVSIGAFGSRRLRTVHRVLYSTVLLSQAAAGIAYAVEGTPIAALICAGFLVLLLGISRFRGRGRGHWMYALLCLAIYTSCFVVLQFYSFFEILHLL